MASRFTGRKKGQGGIKKVKSKLKPKRQTSTSTGGTATTSFRDIGNTSPKQFSSKPGTSSTTPVDVTTRTPTNLKTAIQQPNVKSAIESVATGTFFPEPVSNVLKSLPIATGAPTLADPLKAVKNVAEGGLAIAGGAVLGKIAKPLAGRFASKVLQRIAGSTSRNNKAFQQSLELPETFTSAISATARGKARVNLKTLQQAESLAARTLAQFKRPQFIAATIGTTLGASVYAGVSSAWGIGEAIDTISFAIKDAEKAGLPPEDIAEMEQTIDDLANPDAWNTIATWTPIIGNFRTLDKKTEAAATMRNVAAAIRQDEKDNPDTTFEQANTRMREAKVKSEKELQDRNAALQKEINAERIAASAEGDKKRIKRAREYQLWLNELQRKEAENLAEFWLEYQRQRLKQEELATRNFADNTPSRLNFGLL